MAVLAKSAKRSLKMMNCPKCERCGELKLGWVFTIIVLKAMKKNFLLYPTRKDLPQNTNAK